MTTRLLDHERLRQHRLKAEHFAAHPDLDQRAREHEADEQAYYSRRSKDDSLTAGAICFAIVIAFLIAGGIAGMVA